MLLEYKTGFHRTLHSKQQVKDNLKSGYGMVQVIRNMHYLAVALCALFHRVSMATELV